MSVLPQFVVVAKTLVQHGVAFILRHVFELAGLKISQTDVFHQILLVSGDSRSRSLSGADGGEAHHLFAGIVRNSRTSTEARQATTALRPHARASSRLGASRIQKPPMFSLGSRYGPSVTRTLPSGCARRDFARPAAERPPAKILASAAIISRLSACISSSIASVSTDGS